MVVALLDAARAHVAGSLLVEGEPGIGKSTLLRCAEQRAQGFRCLWVRGVESEQLLGHAGLLQALGPLRPRLAEIPQAQQAALAAALGWGPAGRHAEPFLVAAATLSLLAAEAERTPVLVLVDDVQWVDSESATALTFAARRLQEDAVAFVWSARSGALPGELLGDVPKVTLHGLTPGQASRLLADRLNREVAARLASDVAGNPLALLEVAARLDDAQRVGAAPLPERLPVGERIRAVYEHLLSELSPAAWRAVLLCAVNRSSSLAAVTTALAHEGVDAAEAFDEAVDAGVLVPDGPTLTFRHPLLRASALAASTSAQRRRAHRSLADALADRPHSLAGAWHRAEATAGSDPALAEELIALSDVCRGRQGYAAASGLLERAARLSGSSASAAWALVAAARDSFLAGDVARARALCAAVLDTTDQADIRGRALLTVGRLEVSTGSVPRAVELLASAVDLIEGTELPSALAELALARFRLSDMAGLTDCAGRLTTAADRHDPLQRMLADFTNGLAAAVTGDPARARALMLEVVDQIGRPALRDEPQCLVFLALAAATLNDILGVLPLGEHLMGVARDRGALGVLVPSLALVASGRAWLGDNAGAFADAGEAVELGEQLGYAADVSNAADMLAWQAAARGRDDDARRAIVLARELTDRAGTTAHAAHVAITDAFCALCRGDAQAAADILEPRLVADEGVGAMGEPLGIAPDLVEAYVALGRTAEAAQLASRFAAVTPTDAPPLQLALVARTLGLTAGDADVDDAFQTALEQHAVARHPFETARTHLLYGARLRRSGQRVRAREHLQRAHDAFAAMDLAAWVARSADELAATGAHVRRRGLVAHEPLSSQETRVALRAANGLSNKEIAAALFLSPKTVERHLSSVYRKKGLRSRSQLAASFRDSEG